MMRSSYATMDLWLRLYVFMSLCLYVTVSLCLYIAMSGNSLLLLLLLLLLFGAYFPVYSILSHLTRRPADSLTRRLQALSFEFCASRFELM
ncbi:hypothetical protein BZA77DRAFT_322890 [Pyronema omphalodes]|nr:hypothetical protein BZA77DRAFT_322890 [Pyronema omphalodes]